MNFDDELEPFDLSELDGTDYRPPRHGSDEANAVKRDPVGDLLAKSFWGHAGRPNKRGGSLPADAVSRTLTNTYRPRGTGGSTVSIRDGTVPKRGYIVAGVVGADGKSHERKFKRAKRADVEQYVADYLPELLKPNRYLGAWIHDGHTYLDTSEVYDGREEALALAHTRKEIAIWSIHEGKEIYTMSDQKRPGESTGTEIRKDDEGGGEGHYLIVGRDLSPEAMVDSVMKWLDEYQGPDPDEPSTTATPPPTTTPNPGLGVTHERGADALTKLR